MRGVIAWLLIAAAAVAGAGIGAEESAGALPANGMAWSLLVADAGGAIIHAHDSDRAALRFSPASTFKILNTLIALEAGIVASKDTPMAWDGADHGLPAWNRDQTLESAFRVSCLWCYQEIARSVGTARYAAALQQVGYGNQQVGQQVDRFWLDGTLTISALEQIEFLSKLHACELPFREEHIAELKSIMLTDTTPDYALYAKSGWTGPDLHIGWYVGFVETDEDTWLFALNMDMDRMDQAPLRKQLVMAALRELGLPTAAAGASEWLPTGTGSP